MQSLSLEDAAASVLRGGLVLFPTETFFAIGCNALDAEAVAALYAVKHRPASLPLPIIAASLSMLEVLTPPLPRAALDLANKFWPGPLSLVLPALESVPAALTGGTGNVAVRLSPHPAASALTAAAGVPIVASSANISGEPPATNPHGIDSRLRAKAPLFMCEPLPPGGLPSTIVALRARKKGRPELIILRHGAVSPQQLKDGGFALVPCC